MAQLAEDGTYPGAETIFAQRASALIADFDPAQPRDPDGRWTNWGGSAVQGSDPPVAAAAVHAQRAPAPKTPTRETPGFVSTLLNVLNPIGPASAEEIDPEEENRGLAEESIDPTEPIRVERYEAARNALKEIDPQSHELERWSPHGYGPTEADIARLEAATKAALAAKADLGPPSEALPAIAAANGRLEPSPPGLVFSVSGHSTTAIGDTYSEQVREFYGAVRAPNSNEPGAVVPDGLLIERRSDGDAAIEAKHIQNWFKSSYYIDPETENTKISFGDQVISETVEQALKYATAYPTGVRWVTNSPEFAAAYTAKFIKAKVSNFNFVVIPAVREGRDGSYLD